MIKIKNSNLTQICNEFYEMLCDNFKFVACEKVPYDRVSMGYEKDFNVSYLVDGTKKENNDGFSGSFY